MPISRVRFTVRRMMVAVAIVALGPVAWRARPRLEDPTLDYCPRAIKHAALAQAFATGSSAAYGSVGAVVAPRTAAHHAALARMYERAARYPFLPVAPDPPEPG